MLNSDLWFLRLGSVTALEVLNFSVVLFGFFEGVEGS